MALGSSFHSYPQIFTIGHRYLVDLFKNPVLIEEKVDGSQISFGLIEGELRIKSKGAAINPECPEGMFAKAVAFIKTLDLHPEWTYRGEYLGKPKHNALAYDRVPKNNIIIFDINTEEETYMTYEAKKAEAERLGMETVPILHYGSVDTPAFLLSFLDRPSVLGGQKIEGVVVKNYFRFGQDKKALMGKHVSEAFKEVHSAEWKKSNPGAKDIIQTLILQYKTPARWAKAVQHLREAGKLDGSPKDIGALMMEAKEDIKKECADEIKEALYRYAVDQIMRGCTAGLADWYKNELVKQQFDNQGEVK